MGWRKWWLRAAVHIGLIASLAGIYCAQAQSTNDPATLEAEVSQLYRQGKYVEATPLAERYVALSRQRYGEEHGEFASSITWLANVYAARGRHAEAERLYKRSLAIREKVVGVDHSSIGISLNNLASLYEKQGRHAEAEPLYKRAIAIWQKTLGEDHPDVGTALNNLAVLYDNLGRYAEAEPLYKRSLHIAEVTTGADSRYVGQTLNNLASLYVNQRRYAEAEALYKRSLAIRERALGPDHHEFGGLLGNLAELYRAQRRYAEAERLQKRALDIIEKALGPDDRAVAVTLSNLAGLSFEQRDWLGAADYWRRSISAPLRRAQRGIAGIGQAPTGRREAETEQLSSRFLGLIKAAHRLASHGRGTETGLAREMFQTAQWAQASEAAASLAQMAARDAKDDAGLSQLVRERQDLVAEWQKRDITRSADVSQPPDRRNHAVEAANMARLAAIDTRIAEIDKRLAADFPDYAALAQPIPLSVEEVQAQLGADEALVLFLDTRQRQPTPEETFIWVVTKTDMRWVRSELGTSALAREAAALRCGLDASLWSDEASSTRCRTVLKAAPKSVRQGSTQVTELPFDTARAHSLYRALFGQIEDLVHGKHVLVVPSGPLTQLPLQVLVTAAPTSTDYRAAAWLAKKHAMTVLPAVSSLKALRRIGHPSRATKSMIGFGNPLLDGPNTYFAALRQAALKRQSCGGLGYVQPAGSRGGGGVKLLARRGRTVSLTDVRGATPLPETADELCAVAKAMGATEADIFLGARASEHQIKRLSEADTLRNYRIVHFATHGALAGDIEGSAEAGLLLTPPGEGTETDDGYLSASEVASLRLDADWVILSACNTAAGGAQGAEALSGLARAFFYAGARALLVSHWAVDSAATVKLITSAIEAVTRDNTVGRAEALRRAMLEMIDKGERRHAHPSYWAPFIVVGEGAAAK